MKNKKKTLVQETCNSDNPSIGYINLAHKSCIENLHLHRCFNEMDS